MTRDKSACTGAGDGDVIAAAATAVGTVVDDGDEETICILLLFAVVGAGWGAAFVAGNCVDCGGESLESTSLDDVIGFCTAVEVITDVVVAPVIAAFGEVIRMDDAVAVANVALLVEAGGSFCCDRVDTATDDGADVTD